jgi:hypothetical protein
MPISELYVVEYLLQETEAATDAIVWREKESEGYAARLHGIDVELHSLSNRSGSRLCLSLACYPEKIEIEEPVRTGFFQSKYESEDGQRLAQLLKELAATVSRQCAKRMNRPPEAISRVREAIFRRLIGFNRNGIED